MASNQDRLKQKLAELKTQNGERRVLWKPQPGKQVVRIVPYVHCKDWPFVDLYFHYEIAKKTLISPLSFGRPDPVKEFAEKLQSSGDQDEWKQGRKLEPKIRTYVPIIVRGQEDQGVKFWGMGTQICEQLCSKMDNPKWGDISHPLEGRDIEVTFEKAEKPGAFPKTTIDVDPERTPVTNNKEVLELLKNMPDVKTLWEEPSYDLLKSILKEYIKTGAKVEVSISRDPENDDIETTTAIKDGVKSQVVSNAATSDVESAFASYFK